MLRNGDRMMTGQVCGRLARLAIGFLIVLAASRFAEPVLASPPTMAVADFDYVDTSGEPRDQQKEHSDRLRDFAAAIRADLASSGRYQIVPLACGADPCSAANRSASDLIEDAKRAGAQYLLFGGVHKESTLLGWIKVQTLEVASNRVIFERLLSFRGDSDDAWHHAERFLVADLRQSNPNK
jgi:Protein of unknown function (DUF2380)